MFKDVVGCELKTKHIYLTYVDEYIGAFDPYTGEIRYATSDKFVPFVQEILKDFPEYTPHNVINQGVSEAIREKINADTARKVFAKNLKNFGK